MIILDEALRRRSEEGRPIRAAMFGAGFMGRGIARQIRHAVPGMELVAICNRTVENAAAAYAEAGQPGAREVASADALDDAVRAGVPAVTGDPEVVCAAEGVDVLLEATGAIEYGARVTVSAIEHGKDIVLMNAELDATVGPLLKERADRAGVVYSGCDGDQPGVQLNLLRFVESIGLTPLVCGNIKGLQDRYRTPETQKSFAAQWGQTPAMVTSFADGTKISFEQAIVANATGMTVAQRGMLGLEHRGHVDELTGVYQETYGVERLRELGGVVDYVVGGQPSPGVYVMAANDRPEQEIYLRYGKLGDGPLYSFYVPYHLTIFEAPLSLARAALFGDRVIAPRGAPRVDVVAAAKRDLRAGETLDGIGEFMTYGLCETYAATRADELLPIGIAEGCRLRRDVPQDQVLTRGDVELPDGWLVHELRAEQDRRFDPAAAPGA